jgi:dolichyl-phosphate-mannose-protein mannosyltransferase
MAIKPLQSALLKTARGWISRRLAPPCYKPCPQEKRFVRLSAACAIIFIVAVGVRLLHWQDNRIQYAQSRALESGLVTLYKSEAARIATKGGILFPSEPVERGDARMLIHPPGYSIFLAMLDGDEVTDASDTKLRLVQVILDAGSAVLILLIASKLFPFSAALISGLLVALSPHLANYSLWLTPDSIAVLPILFAVYLITLASERPRLILIISAGALVGLSCWLRANGLLLAPALALAVLLLFERGKRLRYSLSLVAAAAVVIAPITIRNLVVFRHFIPLSIGAGITMIEGIADYDSDGRFGMPQFDQQVKAKDAEWHNRPDYESNIWVPDGIERDRARLARGLGVIRSNPVWFAGVMLKRAAFMLRYNDGGSPSWPLNTALAPVVLREPTFGHEIWAAGQAEPVWSGDPGELLANGAILSSQTEISITDDGQSLAVTGDGSAFGDQFASAPIAVKQDTDYILALGARLRQGDMGIKVTGEDRRTALASTILGIVDRKARKKEKRAIKRGESRPTDEASPTLIQMAFATGQRSEVRLVLSNNGLSDERPVAEADQVRLYELGPTPRLWTGPLRASIRAVQKNLFTTWRMLALVGAGLVLLAIGGRRRALAILLAVPFYYLIFQSALHTEYRYILAIHYFLFIPAAVAIYSAAHAVRDLARRLRA